MAKTAYSNMGLGEVRSRNRRTSKINQRSWRFQRIAKFQRALRFAAAAKAYRLTYEVTQAEVAKVFRVCTGTVCCWESGKYFWQGGRQELEEYQRVVRQIAQS